MRIFLVGFMGSGKTYTGRQLARLLGLPFLDLDEWITERMQLSIGEIFASYGEEHFREVEAQILRELNHLPQVVVACGGGTPCYHDNMEWMNKNGQTVFLDPSESILQTRLEKENSKRPLLQTGESIQQIIRHKMATRRKYYEKAALHLQLDNSSTDAARLILDSITQINDQ